MGLDTDDTGAELETEVWSKLPDELLTIVLAHLPRSCNLRLRQVSKTWNSLLRDFTTLSRYTHPGRRELEHPGSVCLVVGSTTHCAIFNLSKREWFSIAHSSILPAHRSPDKYQVVAASAGLFLMEGKTEELGRFLVNPINKTTRTLPPLPPPNLGYRSTSTILGMMQDSKSCPHRIVAEQTEYEETESDDPLGTIKSCEIYVLEVGRSDTWKLVATLQSEIDLCLEVESAVLVGETLYVLLVQPFGWCWMYRIFRAASTDWKELLAEMVYDLGHVHLFEHRGSLMLVGGTDVLKTDEPLAVGIWRLEPRDWSWSHAMSMPEELVRRLCISAENGVFYHFDVEEDCACFVNPFTETVIVCDLREEDAWQCVQGSNLQHVDDLVFMFHPRLHLLLANDSLH